MDSRLLVVFVFFSLPMSYCHTKHVGWGGGGEWILDLLFLFSSACPCPIVTQSMWGGVGVGNGF